MVHGTVASVRTRTRKQERSAKVTLDTIARPLPKGQYNSAAVGGELADASSSVYIRLVTVSVFPRTAVSSVRQISA